jgi:hypothetical protein
MLRRELLAIIGSSIAAAKWGAIAAVQRPPFRVIDAMPAFWRFWDTTIKESTDKRVRAFFEGVVAAYPDLFRHGMIASGSLTDLEDVPEAQARVAKYLQEVTPLIPTMRKISTIIRSNFPRYVQEFSTKFSDYAPTTPVFFSVSLFGFSGGLLVSGENTGLYFGVDELARSYGSTKNLKVILQHEMFHQYHYQIAPEISENRAAWAYMWEEGLATYVSQRLNPGATADQVLVLPDRLSELAGPHLPYLIERLRTHAESTNPNDYLDLFSIEQTSSAIPARSGYFVGYLVAQKLAETRSLIELVHLQGAELKRAVLSGLAELQTRGDQANQS